MLLLFLLLWMSPCSSAFAEFDSEKQSRPPRVQNTHVATATWQIFRDEVPFAVAKDGLRNTSAGKRKIRKIIMGFGGASLHVFVVLLHLAFMENIHLLLLADAILVCISQIFLL